MLLLLDPAPILISRQCVWTSSFRAAEPCRQNVQIMLQISYTACVACAYLNLWRSFKRMTESRLSTARMRWYSPTVSGSIYLPESGTNTTIMISNPGCLNGKGHLFKYCWAWLLCARCGFGIWCHPHVTIGVTWLTALGVGWGESNFSLFYAP